MDELVKYYIKHTDQRFKEVNQEFKEVHRKLDMLVKFRWMLIGAGVGTSLIVSILWEAAKAMAGK